MNCDKNFYLQGYCDQRTIQFIGIEVYAPGAYYATNCRSSLYQQSFKRRKIKRLTICLHISGKNGKLYPSLCKLFPSSLSTRNEKTFIISLVYCHRLRLVHLGESVSNKEAIGPVGWGYKLIHFCCCVHVQIQQLPSVVNFGSGVRVEGEIFFSENDNNNALKRVWI